jgi:hypothetical protein
MTTASLSNEDPVVGVCRELWNVGFEALAVVGGSLDKIELNPRAVKLI